MAYDDPQNLNATSSVMLGSQIEIMPSMPLPELNSPGGLAFMARYKADASTSLYAILCPPGQFPRLDAITVMRSLDNPGLIRFVDSGVVAWIDGTRAYAIIYQRPMVPRMRAGLDETHPILSEDAINRHFILPMVGALGALLNSGLVHHAIRPTNIFWHVGSSTSPQIGECLSAPAGVGQPVLFEPIERALCLPLGKGSGLHADDCYAFGVTLALLVLGRNPLQGKDDAAIIDLKIQKGSIGALIGSHRLQPSHIEILRGLLSDDARQRWSASDLEQWQNGRRMTPKNSDAGRKAARHFDFDGKEFWQTKSLAMAMIGNIPEAIKVIESESLHKWLHRALNDEERAADVVKVVADLKQNGKMIHYEDQLVARVCMALDHAAPIRYRGLSVMLAGIPTLLSDAAIHGRNLTELAEILSTQLPAVWIQMQKDSKGEYITMGQLFERMKGFIEKTSFGNGLERVIYETNPALACLSPMLKNQYVTTPKQLLPALERIAANSGRPREPLDRHIAAFLVVRDKRSEAIFSPMLMPEGSIRRGLGLLSLFADLQYRHGSENLPQLASWLSPVAEPAIRRFLGKALRETLQKQIKDVTSSGDLSKLLRLLDDPKNVERDQHDFLAARILYLNIQKEIAGLEVKLTNRESVVVSTGKPMAASISSFLALILICAAVLRALFKALFF